ncbi:MAG: acylneuraminate cytidylyltransferase family protein [Candidatus Omnitrophota bacterium]
MYKKKKILAIIPARGGSKGLPRKNIRQVAGKPLIAWTIDEAKKSKLIDRLILSSDDKRIMAAARQRGCEVPFVRPAKFARDHSSGMEPVLHALSVLKDPFDYVVLLQPTSPLRLARDIDQCIIKCVSSRSPACVSVVLREKGLEWMFSLDGRKRLKAVTRQPDRVLSRQDFKKLYELNGAVYVARTDWFIKNKKFITSRTIGFPMPRERSVDIDTEWDLNICNNLLTGRKRRTSGGVADRDV